MDTWQLPVSFALLVFVSSYFKLFSNVLAGFILGIFVTNLNYYLFYQVSWQDLVVDKPVKIVATVSKSIKSGEQPYIQVKIESIDAFQVNAWKTVNANLSVKKYSMPLRQGDKIEGVAKLKIFRSRKNLHAFDSELFAFLNHIYFKGKVEIEVHKSNERDWQNDYRHFMSAVFQQYKLSWLYYTLMTGDKSKIPNIDKDNFRMLGLSHLLAISGLHIAIFFTLSFVLLKILLIPAQSFLKQDSNIYTVGILCALFSSGVYVVISGMQVSAQRAWLMALIGIICYLLGTRISFFRLILYALTIVILISPFSLLNMGLYFSFLAVSCILWFISKHSRGQEKSVRLRDKLVWLMKIQALIFVFLCPITIYAFQGVSISGLALNIVMIPLLSCVLFPAILIQSTIFHVFDVNAIVLLDTWLFEAYRWLLIFNFHWIDIVPISVSQLLAVMLIVALLCTPLTRVYSLIPLIAISLHWWLSSKPLWQINIFDVGHGSAVLVEHDDKAFLYDLGANYFGTYSMFKHVVMPYIKANNIELMHTIVSHDDGDHAGGLKDLNLLGYGNTLRTFHREEYAQPCLQKTVELGSLTIQTIWPQQMQDNNNNSSCVVIVSDSRFKLLLPGDIGTEIESHLVDQHEDYLNASFLLAPHHGSRTSSSAQFIEQVGAELAVFSRSYNTPWQLPHSDVVRRYHHFGYKTYDTALDGQVQIRVFKQHFEVYTARNAKNLWFLR
ncbi:DNA internalization-related competence protein ComEC/Rec2 [Pseudoalteromonas umbrosa]|uniref:DNA internalization-related competence protein ComEC/Rec2 n=1 Tax=Pseudoalteromonas umbrosa TaxID=3048489 RepID=UPI0024C2D255|nr:DNA internalization-related competence protein ComEC/Rec2 [Pseudoalteromonas sp. B95]MDK1286568.1 DNA internalization-related competence protein ComEC/Rec2 [Pseudoalteromonas sp. B95]